MGLWLMLSLALSLVFFREFWVRLPAMLSPGWVFGEHHASPWGVLALCLVFLWLKRKEVWRGMSLSSSYLEQSKGYRLLTGLGRTVIGLGLVAGAVLMPSSPDYLVFQVLLALLGVFIIFFGQAAKIPSILLTIYTFTISFPLMIQHFAEDVYSRIAITPLMWLMPTIGYPLQNEGQWLHFTSSGGEPISIAITADCAGPATMAVFIAIFALMSLDMPLPPKKGSRTLPVWRCGHLVSELYQACHTDIGGLLLGRARPVDNTLLDNLYPVPSVVSPLCLRLLQTGKTITQGKGK